MKSNGEDISMPHGMVVWSTGVGSRPVVKDFMEQIGQVSSHFFPMFWLFLFLVSSYLVTEFGCVCEDIKKNVSPFYTGVLICQFSAVLILLQGSRRVLATDEWLRVKGCEYVYALGDCTHLQQKKIKVYVLICVHLLRILTELDKKVVNSH